MRDHLTTQGDTAWNPGISTQLATGHPAAAWPSSPPSRQLPDAAPRCLAPAALVEDPVVIARILAARGENPNNRGIDTTALVFYTGGHGAGHDA